MLKKKLARHNLQEPSNTLFSDADYFRTLFEFQLNQHTEIEKHITPQSNSQEKKFLDGGAIVALVTDSLAAAVISVLQYGSSLISDGSQKNQIEHQLI